MTCPAPPPPCLSPLKTPPSPSPCAPTTSPQVSDTGHPLTPSRHTGNDKYPHVYNDLERFTFSDASRPYIEFPILPNGRLYDARSATYCATITHDGSSRNGFTECQDDSANPQGKGARVGR